MPNVTPPVMQLRWEGSGKVFITPSKSNPANIHATWVPDNGPIDCTCTGWRMQRKCWHVSSQQEARGEEDFQVSL